MLLRRTEEAGAEMHVAVVHGKDGVHYVAAAHTRAALVKRVADYVRAQADLQLYARDVAILTDMLQRGDHEGGVRFYFQRVGQRWDREWLKAETVAVATEASHRWRLVR